TGWELVRATGEVPTRDFFTLLAGRKFPLVYELRPECSLFASALPDQWHEVFGHIPLLWNPILSEIYQGLGRAAVASLQEGRVGDFETIAKAYWYSCEYGLVSEGGHLKMIGAGLIASPLGTYALADTR